VRVSATWRRIRGSSSAIRAVFIAMSSQVRNTEDFA